MMKTLKQLLEAKKPEVPQPSAPIEPDSVTAYVPKTKDEKRFMDKHVIKKTDDVNGNGDDHFRATNIKVHDRSKGHGYNKGEDQKVYESKTLVQILGEKKLTSAEMKKREEIAGGIEKSNPSMPMAKKMAIATAKAKQVAEDTQLDESASSAAQYSAYHADSKKMLDKIAKGLDQHHKYVHTKSNYSQGEPHWDHVQTMKSVHRNLQDMHDNVLMHGDWAKPPEVKAIKEEVDSDLFSVFAEDVREQIRSVFETLSEDNQQLMIEMIEDQDYDTVIEVVKEVSNG